MTRERARSDPLQPWEVAVLTIECAAIRLPSGLVVSAPRPERHHDIIRKLARAGMDIPIQGDQGFLTNTGSFVGRREAAEIAKLADQVAKFRAWPNLYSEDVW